MLSNQVVREFSGLIEDEGKNVSITWDGRDGQGNILPDLTYKYRIYLETDVDSPITWIIPDKDLYINNNTNYASLNTCYTLKAVDYGRPISDIDSVYYRINENTNWNIYENAILACPPIIGPIINL